MPSTTSSTTRTYDASRRQADAVARRRRVVDGAHELFLEQGYGETSINQIARRADVSPQTVYAAFESKAGVLAKVVDVVVAGDYAAIGDGDETLLVRDRHAAVEALSHPDLRERFGAVAHYAAISHVRSGPILRLVETVAGSDPAIAQLLQHLVAGVREDVDVAMREVPVTSLRPGIDHALAVDLAFHLVGWRAFHTFTVECGWTVEQYEQHLAGALIHLLLPDEPAG
jgi:AcrR family transcriptional regulator